MTIKTLACLLLLLTSPAFGEGDAAVVTRDAAGLPIDSLTESLTAGPRGDILLKVIDTNGKSADAARCCLRLLQTWCGILNFVLCHITQIACSCAARLRKALTT
jgi:hypothetical protein